MISFIMPAKNSSVYIRDAIQSVIRQTKESWELIIVDDNSTDNTAGIANEFSKLDSRIKTFKNIGVGKVVGLNYGFSLCKGAIIKCIDSDDVLHEDFVETCLSMDFDAMYHDAVVTSSTLKATNRLSFQENFIKSSYKDNIVHFKSLPRWVWSFTKELGNKIFPMPNELSYEDLWFSLIIKKYAKRIRYIRRNLYYYRQHDNQTFMGIFNYSDQASVYRANRRLIYIDILINRYELFWDSRDDLIYLLSDIKKYLELMCKQNLKLNDIIFSKLPLFYMIRLLIIKKLPLIASYIKANRKALFI